MKLRQETTSLGQIVTVTAKPTIIATSSFINTDTKRFKIQTGDLGPPPPMAGPHYIYTSTKYDVHQQQLETVFKIC